MTDIRKTIERLKKLEAEATSGKWNERALGWLLRFGQKNDGCWADDLPMGENLPGRDDADLIVTMRNALPELLQKLHELLPSNNEKLVTEWCSECGAEVSMHWDIKDAGYKAYCPHCGSHLMLCSECIDEHGACGSRDDCDERDYARDKSNYSGGE